MRINKMLFRRGGARTQWLSTERGESKWLWWEGVKRRRDYTPGPSTPPLEAVRVSNVLLARAPELPIHCCPRQGCASLCCAIKCQLNDIKSSLRRPFLSSVLRFYSMSVVLYIPSAVAVVYSGSTRPKRVSHLHQRWAVPFVVPSSTI